MGPSSNTHRSESSKSETILVHLDNQTHYIRPEDVLRVPDTDHGKGFGPNSGVEQDVQAARNRLRRFIGGK